MDRLRIWVNGAPLEVEDLDPNTTLLDYLRARRLTGTKEGCREGDCGACTVGVVDVDAAGGGRLRAVNACLVLLPMVQGRRIYTCEGLATGDRPHLVQRALAEALGSQCGYCTPGVVLSLAEACYRSDLDEAWKLDDQLCGNLCRCTGYRPIRDAARRVAGQRPEGPIRRLLECPPEEPPVRRYGAKGRAFFMPETVAEAVRILGDHPEARVVAGGTDLSLEITKAHRRFPALVSVEGIEALRIIETDGDTYRIGAAAPLTDVEAWARDALPPLERMLRFFGSRQIKHRATLGGNLCNASPIGDTAPVLLALDASLEIEGPQGRRSVDLSDFFVGYRKTALGPGEIVTAVRVPRIPGGTRASAYKVSKRREMDISTVSAGLSVHLDGQRVTRARFAFGGVAPTPLRVTETEAAVVGRPWTQETVEAAAEVLEQEIHPIDDHRGSAWYRRTVARNLLRAFYLETLADPLPRLPDRPTSTVALEVRE